jgi:hypothetical protein
LVVPQRLRRHLAHTAHVRSDDVALPRDVDRGLLDRKPLRDQSAEQLEGTALLSLEDPRKLASLFVARRVFEEEATSSVSIEKRRPGEVDEDGDGASGKIDIPLRGVLDSIGALI